ncbi:DUF1236 domain-containing protein [Rhodoplanes sp. Z2-YC6860]|uniref:DUF1236 domain-containing protein n=1 Tax=Rhodoplanes sp. Z2-YC6860 TaxID=674703 RepID=UPI00078C3D3E|nr:DUF1236 domain-containing protein [Rhodoplanes sp. Z2-YC6860]AMN44968.1 hypothetical protein RHPLAN_65620 [Rhodoplanes sp. Z2-YC6860]
MRTLLLTAAAAAALASASPVAQAQDTQSQSNTVEPRSVKTETIRRTDQPGQAPGQATTDSRGNETTAATPQKVQQPSATRETASTQRHRVTVRQRPRAASTRISRTHRPVTTGRATRRVSSDALPSRARPQYAQATAVIPAAPPPAGRIVLTEPQVSQLNAAFTSYITRTNVWSRPPWEVAATVTGLVPPWIQVYGMPAEIVAIYPDFAGRQFVVVGDDIVVLDPGTRRIVSMISRVSNTAVLEAPPSTTGVAVASPDVRVRLTRTQIATVRTVLRDRGCRYDRSTSLSIGSVVPTAASICAFPERVVSAVPDIAGYRYITRRNVVMVIDPATDQVVTVLR